MGESGTNDSIRTNLLKWFERNRKDYPFRGETDAYRVVVCEILLKKTTARQVSDIYHKFFSAFPRVEDLACASVEEILDVIRVLGLHKRAHELKQMACLVVEEHDGRVPSDFTTLTSITGIGRYVAGCVLAFAYDTRAPMVDSNIDRILIRMRGYKALKGSPQEKVWETYAQLAPTESFREFHYAMIDLAHGVCRPKRPRCAVCPLRAFCSYPAVGKTEGRAPSGVSPFSENHRGPDDG